MIDKSFLQQVEHMAAPTMHTIGARQYSSKALHLVAPPVPDAIKCHTLTGVADYIKKLSTADLASPNVQVLSPGVVHVRSALSGDVREREHYLTAECIFKPFKFDEFVSVEMFIIQLQAMFVQDEVTASILQVVGNLKAEASKTSTDDGCTQLVTTKQGVVGVAVVSVPNPVTLRPYRTFAEVMQPASQFVFRMKDAGGGNPSCALFEADGGAWKLEAIKNIAAFLAGELPDTVIIA